MFFSNLFRAKNLPAILVATSIITYIFSMRIVSIDHSFSFRWYAFTLHIISLGTVFFLYLRQSLTKKHYKKIFTEQEINPPLLILIITIVANFLLLSIYPYVSIADELRDGGLFAMKIAAGIIPNIFGYGSYDAHGLIIPTLTIPFYYLFGNNVLTYRFPAAILSTADVLFLYLLVRIILNRSAAFWSSLVLALLPLHIFFAHTQVVVAFNFFWSPIILLAFVILRKKHRSIDYIFFGTLLGFASGFHAAIRVLVCVTFCLLIFLEIKDIIMHKFQLGKKLLLHFTKIALLIGFLFVGFGPRLLFTGPQDFFHSSRFILENQIQTNTPITLKNLSTIKSNYIKSLMVYTYEPTTFFYPDLKPIFTPLLAVFFLLGIGYAFFVLKNQFLNMFLFLLIVLPFFLSAITDVINASHRLSPLFAPAAIFVGIGISYCLNAIRNKEIRAAFITVMISYFAIQLLTFFTRQPANLTVKLPGYLDMHAIYFLHKDNSYHASYETYLKDIRLRINDPQALSPVCFYVSPSNYLNYMENYVAYFQQQQMLLPSVNLNYREDSRIRDNEVYILPNTCNTPVPYTKAKHTYRISCSYGNSYTCPLTYSGTITIHY